MKVIQNCNFASRWWPFVLYWWLQYFTVLNKTNGRSVWRFQLLIKEKVDVPLVLSSCKLWNLQREKTIKMYLGVYLKIGLHIGWITRTAYKRLILHSEILRVAITFHLSSWFKIYWNMNLVWWTFFKRTLSILLTEENSVSPPGLET